VTRILLGLAALALSACAGPAPGVPSGPWRQLNVGKWDFSSTLPTTLPPSQTVAAGRG
jgi:hypothetical protein